MVFSYYKQETNYSCGAAAMRMVLENVGIKKSERELIELLGTNPNHGTTFKDFSDLTKKLGLEFIAKKDGSLKELRNLIKEGYLIIVCYFILEEDCHHYSVVRKIEKEKIYFWDPWFGKNHKYSLGHFRRIWRSKKKPEKADKWFIAVKTSE